MDGLLIDSEPLWQEAEIMSFQEVWITLSTEDTYNTTWLRVDEVVDFWFEKIPWDIHVYSKEKLTLTIEKNVKLLIAKKWTPKSGVREILSFFTSIWVDKIAIASSSSYEIIQTVVKKFGITKEVNFIFSAENEPFWKPHPGVYIQSYTGMWLSPYECIAFEDSLNWIISAKAAKIYCIAIPEKENINNPKFQIADMSLNSLLNFWTKEWEQITTWVK